MRFILWSLLAAYLTLIGLWPAAAAPVALAAAGVGTVIGQLPVVLVIAAAVWLYRRSASHAHHRTA